MKFTFKDIQWVRCVTRNKGDELASYEPGTEKEFQLHWSSSLKDNTHPSKPLLGDLILLHQNPKKYGRTQLTHLVTPVDNRIYIDHKNRVHKWYRKVRVIARALDGYNPKPDQLLFNKVNTKYTFEIGLVGSRPNYTVEEIQQIIWKSFNISVESDLNLIYEDLEPERGFNEGTLTKVEGYHIYRERNSKIVTLKKTDAFSRDRLYCECCQINFEKIYGFVGIRFIECHHKIPIMDGERITRLEDLALVCSNCHRMLHRKKEDGNYHSVESLKELIENSKI